MSFESWTTIFVLLPLAVKAPLSPLEMGLWATLIALIGGSASALRKGGASFSDCLKVGSNTALLGGSVALIGYYWCKDDSSLSFLLLGAVGFMSLGGLATIDWLHDLARKRVEKRIGDEDKKT
mgnify:CR=1 FL=1